MARFPSKPLSFFRVAALATMLFIAARPAGSFPGPLDGTEPIPDLMSKATLVCKGSVASTHEVVPLAYVNREYVRGIAIVRWDRCFKGEPPTPESPVQISLRGPVQMFVDPPGDIILKKGDYKLLFLASAGNALAAVDPWFGDLDISHRLAKSDNAGDDPMARLEADLDAGISDRDQSVALDSIRMLGNMRHVRNLAPLKDQLASTDPLRKAYVYLALLRLHDYADLAAAEAAMAPVQPDLTGLYVQPTYRLDDLRFDLSVEVEQIRDSAAGSYLESLANTENLLIRKAAQQALQNLGPRHMP